MKARKRWSYTVANPVMVAARQQGGAGRRADRRGMEGVVGDAGFTQSRERWRMNFTAKGVCLSETDVINQHDQDVR